MDTTGEVRKSKDIGSMGESGLGKSIDSGYGRSVDKKDQTVEDLADGREGVIKDMSQGEPTVIHATQTVSQDGDTHLEDDVFTKGGEEPPASVIAQPSGAEDVPEKGVKKSIIDGDGSSSGPYVKVSTRYWSLADSSGHFCLWRKHDGVGCGDYVVNIWQSFAAVTVVAIYPDAVLHKGNHTSWLRQISGRVSCV